MQKLLWIGPEGFAPALGDCGWDVAIQRDWKTAPSSWNQLVSACDFTPDVLVVSALSPFIRGMEGFPCLTVLYLPQTAPPEWAISYSAGFDACLVAASDFICHFQHFIPAERVLWSPPHAGRERRLQPDARPNCLFMGASTSQTETFLAKLAEKGLSPERGKALTPACGQLILTANEPGEFDGALLDLMGTGCCVVTPRVGNGLERLFVDGEHFVGYAPRDAGDAAYRLNFLLKNAALVEHIGKSAREAINGGHREIHRARAFTDFLCDILLNDPQGIIASRLSQAADLGSFIEPVYKPLEADI